ITLSDVKTVQALGLVDQSAPSVPMDSGTDPVVERLIDRVLVLQEVERYAPTPPDDKTIDADVERIAHALGSDAVLHDRLQSLGVSPAWLRQFVTDALRIHAYIDQRFGNVVQPTDEELEAYFRDHRSQFAGRDVNDAAVQAEARAAIVAERR